MTEDPIKDGLNWYAYCGGNPVRFVDPSGMIIVAAGSTMDENGKYYIDEDTKQENIDNALNWCQSMSDDILGVSDDGKIIILEENIDGQRVNGTQLVRELIYSTEINEIVITDKTSTKVVPEKVSSAEYAETTGTKIILNMNETSKVMVGTGESNIIDDNTYYLCSNVEEPKPYLKLAHELIHAYGFNTGSTYSSNSKTQAAYQARCYYIYNDVPCQETYLVDEYMTVGINTFPPNNGYVITENGIRRENGELQRVAYKSPMEGK